MKKLVTHTIVTVCVLSAITFTGCRSVSPKLHDEYIRPGLSEGMCSVFDKYRQLCPEMMVKDKIPGLSIAVVDHEGILWMAGFGRTGDWGQPVTPDTLFSVGSTSKTFTATAVMILEDEDKLSVDDPVSDYISEFHDVSLDGLRPSWEITIRDLMTHTSGIGGSQRNQGSLKRTVELIAKQPMQFHIS